NKPEKRGGLHRKKQLTHRLRGLDEHLLDTSVGRRLSFRQGADQWSIAGRKVSDITARGRFGGTGQRPSRLSVDHLQSGKIPDDPREPDGDPNLLAFRRRRGAAQQAKTRPAVLSQSRLRHGLGRREGYFERILISIGRP